MRYTLPDPFSMLPVCFLCKLDIDSKTAVHCRITSIQPFDVTYAAAFCNLSRQPSWAIIKTAFRCDVTTANTVWWSILEGLFS